MKHLKNYHKPTLKKYGDITKLTKGAWKKGDDGDMMKQAS